MNTSISFNPGTIFSPAAGPVTPASTTPSVLPQAPGVVPIARLVGAPPAFTRDNKLALNAGGSVVREVFRYKIGTAPKNPRDRKEGYVFTGEEGRTMSLEGIQVSHGRRLDNLVLIGDRWYKASESGEINIRALLEEPALWMGNTSLFYMIGVDAISTEPSNEAAIDMFWDRRVPREFESPLPPSPAAVNYALSFLTEENPYLRLHAVIALVRRNWEVGGAVSLQFLDALRDLGEPYLQHGMRTALGLNLISPSLWPSDWENQLILLLTQLQFERGIRNLKVDKARTSMVEQRVFKARLKSVLENISSRMLHPKIIAQAAENGDLFGLPVRIDGQTLVIDSERLLGEREFGRLESGEPSGAPGKSRMPTRGQMVLDGLRRLAEQGMTRAVHDLARIRCGLALHNSSLVAGRRSLKARAGVDEHEGLPEGVGFIRGGFGPGGAARECLNWLNWLSDDLGSTGVKIFVGAGFFHEDASLPSAAVKTILPAVDRATHFDSITRHIFDPESKVSADELQMRYDEAVERSAHEIAAWAFESGIEVVIASQMGNVFENPIAMPAILGAKLLLASVGREMRVIFRDNYFRDPEGQGPRIALWQDRHPNLDPNMRGVVHLVESPAGGVIAGRQYGINRTFFLPRGVNLFAGDESPSVSGVNAAPMEREDGEDQAARFARLMRSRADKVRDSLSELYGVPKDAVVILSPSRIAGVKRLDMTLKLVAGLKPLIDRDIHLLVLGESVASDHRTKWSGDEKETRESFDAMAEEMGLADKVHLLGFIPHEPTGEYPFTLQDLMASADLVSQFSDEATFGMSSMEAMASGVPIVMTNFRYPGSTFGSLFSTYKSVYEGCNVFVHYQKDGDFDPGMLARIARTLDDEKERMRIVHPNYLRIGDSQFNGRFTRGYLKELLRGILHFS